MTYIIILSDEQFLAIQFLLCERRLEKSRMARMVAIFFYVVEAWQITVHVFDKIKTEIETSELVAPASSTPRSLVPRN
jgi:hypothetical protein